MRQKKVRALKKAGLWKTRKKWNKNKLPMCSRVKVRRVEKHWGGKDIVLYYYKFPKGNNRSYY